MLDSLRTGYLDAYADSKARAHTPMLMTEGDNPNHGFGSVEWIREQWVRCGLVTALSTCIGLLRQACPREAPLEKTEAEQPAAGAQAVKVGHPHANF